MTKGLHRPVADVSSASGFGSNMESAMSLDSLPISLGDSSTRLELVCLRSEHQGKNFHWISLYTSIFVTRVKQFIILIALGLVKKNG